MIVDDAVRGSNGCALRETLTRLERDLQAYEGHVEITSADDASDVRHALDADGIAAVLADLPASRPAHLLVVQSARPRVPNGKRTFDEVMRDAIHRGVVVHGLTFAPDEAGALEPLARDLGGFVRDPEAPLERPRAHLRHGARLTGGAHRTVVHVPAPAPPTSWTLVAGPLRLTPEGLAAFDIPTLEHLAAQRPPDRPKLREEISRRRRAARARARSRLRRRWGLPVTYGPRLDAPDPGAPPRDVLDLLARGVRRPGEASPDALPDFLRGRPLEPLLDAIWDFVDARADAERIISDLSGQTQHGPSRAGRDLAQAILGPPDLPPSRR